MPLIDTPMPMLSHYERCLAFFRQLYAMLSHDIFTPPPFRYDADSALSADGRHYEADD